MTDIAEFLREGPREEHEDARFQKPEKFKGTEAECVALEPDALVQHRKCLDGVCLFF